MKKRKIFYKRRLMRNTTSLISILVFAILIFSNAAVSTVNILNDQDKLKTNEKYIGLYTGLAPNAGNNPIPSALDSINLKPKTGSDTLSFGNVMYGYTAYNGPHGEGPCYWDIDDPTVINQLSNHQLPTFAAGGTWTNDGRWLVCEYTNGALYEIDPNFGTITLIGVGGVGLYGLAYDPVGLKLYGCSGDTLYEINPVDGSQTPIGPFNTGETHIAIACDSTGTMYSWNIRGSGESWLYKVDKSSGLATPRFSLGKTLNHAQDGDFNRADNTLYLTAYIISPEYGGYFCKVDFVNQRLDIIDQFDNSAEVTGSACPSQKLGVFTNRLFYRPGEPVAITVCNMGTVPVEFSRNPKVDIYDDLGNHIWPPSTIPGSYVLMPTTFPCDTCIWDQTDLDGNPVPCGKYYTIKTASCLPDAAEATTEIFIRDRGYVILVAGSKDDLQQVHINTACNQIYDDLIFIGYTNSRIWYLNKLSNPRVDTVASSVNLQNAITTWASSRVGPCEPLFLIMFGLGSVDEFFVDNSMFPDDTVFASDLAIWLNTLETATDASIYVCYTSSHSGSFIDDLSSPERVIITSCNVAENSYLNYASPYREFFSDVYWQKIRIGQSLCDAFNYGSWHVARSLGWYHPLLDDNADDVGHGFDIPAGSSALPHDGDGDLSRWVFMKNTGRIFPWISYVVAKEFYEWPPQNSTTLWATVENSAPLVHVRAWMLPPDWIPPPPDDDVFVEVPLECFEMWDSDEDGTWTVDIPAENFTNHASGPSDFRFMITAEEENGNTALPLWTAVGFTETGQPPPDNTSPWVWIDFPLYGQIANGTISINGTATDDVCLQKAEFYIDEDLVGVADLSPTSNSFFELMFDTTMVSDGCKTIQAKVFDISNNVGNHTVNITVVELPTAPIINGPLSGKAGLSYNYTFNATDPDEDDIYYYIDWGDRTSTGWIGLYPSGEEVNVGHVWDKKGTYTIKAKAKTPYAGESNWATLEVTMPRNKPSNFNFNLLGWLFERFPMLERLLNLLR